MADQVGSGTVHGAMSESDGLEPQGSDAVAPVEAAVSPGKHVSYHGRPVSWVAVSIIIVGFFVGGIALVAGPVWWLFWAGGAVALVGCILAGAIGIFNDWY
jgi:pheromone shutdown protein TraB